MLLWTGAQAQALQESKPDSPRDHYRFEASFIIDNEGYPGTIVVKGFTPQHDSPFMEVEHELVERLAGVPGADIAKTWIDDEIDINFDGYPDLLIYIGRNSVGRIEDYYAAYVWDEENGYLALIPGFDEIPNPEFHADSKTITSTTRTDAAEKTTWTYVWDGWQLEIIDEKISNLFDDEDE